MQQRSTEITDAFQKHGFGSRPIAPILCRHDSSQLEVCHSAPTDSGRFMVILNILNLFLLVQSSIRVCSPITGKPLQMSDSQYNPATWMLNAFSPLK